MKEVVVVEPTKAQKLKTIEKTYLKGLQAPTQWYLHDCIKQTMARAQ